MRKFFTFLLVFLFAYLSYPSIHASERENYAEQIQIIERFVNTNMKNLKIPGLAVGFYKDDFMWSKGFGFADLESRVPATSDTLFRAASVTKSMTAVGILKLAEDGKINLDDEVQVYVPYFPKKKWPVTIRYLLGHLGGISHYRGNDADTIKTHYNTRQSIAIFEDWELEAEPGTKYIYSSYGYNLLGAVIEGASGLSYADYMSENVWKPLGMNHTRMDIAEEIIPNRASVYRIRGGEIKNDEFVDISSRFAAGGVLTTVKDMLNFSRGLDNGGVLSLQAQERMYDSMQTKDGRFTGYGMGWRIGYLSGSWIVYHRGRQAGSTTHLLRFPNKNFAAFVVSNTRDCYAGRFVELIQNIILGIFNIDVELPLDDKDEFQKLYSVWNYGLGYFDRYNRPLTEDADELKKSFEYFNQIDAQDEKAEQKISDGIHDTTEQPMVKVGTYMAPILKETFGPEKMDYYRKMGPIPFFRDYIDLYKRNHSIPREYHFTKTLEKTVNRWDSSWDKVWTDEIKSFLCLPITDMPLVKERIKNIFKDETIYQDFNIIEYASELMGRGEMEKAEDLFKISVEIYPKIVNRYTNVGYFYYLQADLHEALKYFHKALKLDKNDEYSARYISWLKYAVDGYKELIQLPPETLRKFVGDYGPRHITYQDGHLYYNRNGGGKYKIIPLNKDTFALKGSPGFRIQFVLNKDGQAVKIIGLYIDGRKDESSRDS